MRGGGAGVAVAAGAGGRWVGGGGGQDGLRTRSSSTREPREETGWCKGTMARGGAPVIRKMWCAGERDFLRQTWERTAESGVERVTQILIDCANSSIVEMWIRRILEEESRAGAVLLLLLLAAGGGGTGGEGDCG